MEIPSVRMTRWVSFEILKSAKAKNVEVHIPVDVVAADSFSNDANTQVVDKSDSRRMARLDLAQNRLSALMTS